MTAERLRNDQRLTPEEMDYVLNSDDLHEVVKRSVLDSMSLWPEGWTAEDVAAAQTQGAVA